jgi:hypothetical protein
VSICLLENQVGDQTCQGYEHSLDATWVQLGCNTKYGSDWDKLEAIVKEEVGVF